MRLRPSTDQPTPPGRSERAFVLLKVSIALFLLSVAAVFAVPAVKTRMRESRAAAAAAELREIAAVFQTYAHERGDWPPAALPPEFETRLRATRWSRPTPIGGRYAWAPNSRHQGERHRAALVIAGDGANRVSTDKEQLVALDRQLDNGNLAAGNFRLGYRDEPVYVLEH